MTEILLTSEAFVKDVTCISDNVAGKYLLPAIREAQTMGLRCILGDALTDALETLVGSGEAIPEEYTALLEKCQYYLAYKAVSELTLKVSYKVSNYGVSRNTDEHTSAVDIDEVILMKSEYQAKADFYCKQLQRFLLKNAAQYPELTQNTCRSIRAQLYSSASCGIFLGGARGKQVK